MPTENPKISAYVPQVVYDRFKKFQEERGLSMSQAAIEVFVEYFGINLADNSTKEFTSGLPDRVGQLEQIVSDLKQSYIWLTQKLDSIQSTGGLPVDILKTSSDATMSELPDSLPIEPVNNIQSVEGSDLVDSTESSLPEVIPLEESIYNNDYSGDDSSLLGKPPRQLQLIQSDETSVGELLDQFRSNPLQGKLLASRLNTNSSKLSSTKNRLSEQEFYDWVASKDPDQIRWKSASGTQGYSKGYVPEDDTPLELLHKLSAWLKENTK